MGEPSGSGRLIGVRHSMEQPEETATPPAPGRRPPAAHPRSSDQEADEARADERTAPFPYAEKFGEWVADETDPNRRQQRGRARG